MKTGLSEIIHDKILLLPKKSEIRKGRHKRMEHKGGRIKDHISREKHPGQDDWMDVEWLDEEDKGMMTEEPTEIWSDISVNETTAGGRDTYGRSKALRKMTSRLRLKTGETWRIGT